MAEADKSKAIENAVLQIEKQFGKGAIMQLGDSTALDIQGISTGALSIDIALGGRGLPRGRVVEIFGPESSGKTTIALHALAQAQKQGGVAAFIDAEHALDPSWAKKVGVDLEGLLVSQPSCAEEALQIAEMLVKSNAVDVIVIDSVAALVPRNEVEADRPGLDHGDGLVGVLRVAKAHDGALAELLLDRSHGGEDRLELFRCLAHVPSCVTGPGGTPGAFARSTAARAS